MKSVSEGSLNLLEYVQTLSNVKSVILFQLIQRAGDGDILSYIGYRTPYIMLHEI